MTKVLAIIPVKESTRFPHKNRLLASYTFKWLEDELKYTSEEDISVDVVVAGKEGEIPELPERVLFVDTPCVAIKDDLNIVESKFAGYDCYLLLQLTQPVRYSGMLRDAIILCLSSGKPTISATLKQDESWRKLTSLGQWSKQNDTKELFYDGRIYAWQPSQLDELLDRTHEHSVLVSEDSYIVDVDYKEDLTSKIRQELIESGHRF